MKKQKIALVGVASEFESGGERGPELMESAKKQFAAAGAQVIEAEKMVWNTEDALVVVDQLKNEAPDLLVIIHVTWVCDSLQYVFVNNLDCPIVLWAVPYTETFSIGCVQHFGSILTANGYKYSFIYGLPSEDALVNKVVKQAKVAAIVNDMKAARIALIGPRQTWRVANSQDMVKEEWDFSKKFGTTIIHIEMEEVTAKADKISDTEADLQLEKFRKEGRMGTVQVDNDRLRSAAKVYLAMRSTIKSYGLTAAAAECYPMYGGLMNLPSSWLADDGFVLDTEGDIGHSYLMAAMNEMGEKGPIALGEIGSINYEENLFDLAHEGSTAHSLAEDTSKVFIQNGGDGIMVGLPYKPLPEVTVSHLVGVDGNYKLMILPAETLAVTHEEWVEGGSKLMARLKVDNAKEKFETMIEEGIDHHYLIKEGDVCEELEILCELLALNKVSF